MNLPACRRLQICLLIFVVVDSSTLAIEAAANESSGHSSGVKIASLRFEYVKTELILTCFIVIVGLFKLGTHEIRRAMMMLHKR